MIALRDTAMMGGDTAHLSMRSSRNAAATEVALTATAGPGSTAKYQIPVVRSTFRILEELSRARSLELKEITSATGVSKSTVFRIVNTLLELGYLVRDADRSYRISIALGHLLDEDAKSEIVRTAALPYMLHLRNTYGETVNLGVRYFDKVVYVEVVPSEFALRLQESRGVSVPAHASALGKAILAYTPQAVIDDILRRHKLKEVTSKTITDATVFHAEVKRVRAHGIAFDRGEGSLLATCIGAPILDGDGLAIAAMSISGPTSRFHPKRGAPVIEALLKATASVSKDLNLTSRG